MFNCQIMPRTSPQTKYVKRGEEGVRASDLGPSENQAAASNGSDFKQNPTEGATTATVTKKDWREYVRERSSNSTMRSCMQNAIDRLEVKSLSKSLLFRFLRTEWHFSKEHGFYYSLLHQEIISERNL